MTELRINNIFIFFIACSMALCPGPQANGQAGEIIQDSFVYRIVGKDSLKAFLFQPAGHGKNRAAILLFHGGAWRLGDASWTFPRAKQFAESGMVAICIDYQLCNNGPTPIDGVEDACEAFSWARDHADEFGIDVKKVAGYGVSAGGHLVAATATVPAVKGKKITAASRPNAELLYSPALNMAHDPYFVSLINRRGDPADYSPSEFISASLVPTLIIQGQQDSIVFTKDAEAFRDAAKKLGVECSLFIYPHVGHLLTRNIKVQYMDFDSDPEMVKDARQKEDNFLKALGYIKN